MRLNSLKDPFVHNAYATVRPQLNSRTMPTEREQETLERLYKEGHFKSENPSWRLSFLHEIDLMRQCKACGITRIIIVLLACYGLYSLIF